jgi:hypothetical protein
MCSTVVRLWRVIAGIGIYSNDCPSAGTHTRLERREVEVSSKQQNRTANAFRYERMDLEMQELLLCFWTREALFTFPPHVSAPRTPIP